jgi:NOL1/NOP2/fmu family ribosome biogenesis protein
MTTSTGAGALFRKGIRMGEMSKVGLQLSIALLMIAGVGIAGMMGWL